MTALIGLVRRGWIGLAAAALTVLVIAYGSPAWAAPVGAPLNQTVPRPTPTPSNDPMATPTPLSDGGSDDGSDNGSDDADDGADDGSFQAPGDGGEGSAPSPLSFLQQENAVAAQEGLLATVTVGQLNVRSGPGVTFPVVSSVAQGAQVTVLFRNEDGTWWYVCCAPGMTADGWISADLVEPGFDRAQALSLLPLFGAETAQATPTAAPQTNNGTASAASASAAGGPLILSAAMDPPFAWQGQTVTLHFQVTNPHAVAVTNVEFSDELPATLAFVGVEADSGGQTRNQSTANGGMLVVVRWPRIPAGASVSATIEVTIAENLPPGAVIDNLFAARSTNAAYTTGALSVGMPPITLPSFQ